MKKRLLATVLACALCTALIVVPALALIATDFTMTGTQDVPITFTAGNFTAHVENYQIDYITVKTLPTETNGILTLDDVPVTAEQQIDVNLLALLKFVPDADFVGSDAFTFTATYEDDTTDAATVTLTITADEPTEEPTDEPTDEPTETPEIEPPVAEDKTLDVLRNTARYGQLHATDPQELPLTYSIVTQPTLGTVEITDTATGDFTYTPDTNKLGDDSFTFQVTNGEKESNIATVTVTVALPVIDIFDYADMKTHWANTSAGSLGTLGFIVGEKIGDDYYFNPARNVTRGELMLMINSVIAYPALPDEADTTSPYVDIRDYLNDVANKAFHANVVTGVMVNGERHLLPDRDVTRLEAMKMLATGYHFPSDNTDPLPFSDAAAIPSWARQAIQNLVGYGIVASIEGELRPHDTVTRGEAVELLYKLYKENLIQLSHDAIANDAA